MDLRPETRNFIVEYLELLKRNSDNVSSTHVIDSLRRTSPSELYGVLDIMNTEMLKILLEGNPEKFDECKFIIDSYRRDVLQE